MTNKIIKRAGLFAATAALALGTTSANAVPIVNTLLFQGVTETTTYDADVDPNAVTLRMENAVSGGSGDWANIKWLWSISIDPVGDVTSATIDPAGDFSGDELNNQGCSGGGSGKACFVYTSPLLLDDDMSFVVNYFGGPFDFTQPFHVKVAFLCPDDSGNLPAKKVLGPPGSEPTWQACGNLMSKDIYTSSGSSGASGASGASGSTGTVPEGGSSLLLLGLGLLGVGFMRRQKMAA